MEEKTTTAATAATPTKSKTLGEGDTNPLRILENVRSVADAAAIEVTMRVEIKQASAGSYRVR